MAKGTKSGGAVPPATLEEALARIAELEAQNQALVSEVAVASAKPIQVTIAKGNYAGTYQINAPKVHLPGVGDVSAQELAADEEMLSFLIQIESGIIEKID